MAILPSKTDTLKQHRDEYELTLCLRDYNLLGEHHPDILDEIERAVMAGASPELVRRWTVGVVAEPLTVQRCYNAARYVARGADG